MTLPTFGTVTGPIGTDPADGATGYNILAKQIEDNFDVWNAWQTKAQASFVSNPVVTGSALATPATGWAFDTYAYRQSWGRKWAGLTFISMSLLRTGATISVTENDGGNIADTTIATMAVGWRPLRRFWVSACNASYSPCQVFIDPTGVAKLYTMASAMIPFVTNRLLTLCALFPNTEATPYP